MKKTDSVMREKQKKYTDRDILFAVHSYMSGASPSQIKKEFGMTRQYLNLCLKKLGVEPREEKHNWDWIKANLQPNPINETKEAL